MTSHPTSVVHTATRAIPARDTQALGENPLLPEVLHSYWRIAQWSADKPAQHIIDTVNHWSCTLYGVNYDHLSTKYQRGAVYSKMNERLSHGESVDGANIHIGNIFGR